MGVYRVAEAARAGVNTAGTMYWELRGATAERLYVREFGIFVSTAMTNAMTWTVARNGNSPTSTTNLTPALVDIADAATVATVGKAWSTAPTVGAVLSTFALPVTSGGGFIWVASGDRDRIVVPATAGAGINFSATATGATVGAISWYCVWEE